VLYLFFQLPLPRAGTLVIPFDSWFTTIWFRTWYDFRCNFWFGI